MKRAIRRWLRVVTHPYRVVVAWGGCRVVHRALSVEEGIEWLRQYPEGSSGVVVTRTGRPVAFRRTIDHGQWSAS